MSDVAFQFTKWGGSIHWHFPAQELGVDEYGHWYVVPSGTMLQRGSEPPISKDGFVVLVPQAGEWIAAWNELDAIAVYVDVTSAPRVGVGVVTAIDLDLDVVRWRDGRVEILDVDEFQSHSVSLGYPAHVVTEAEATAQHLVTLMEARVPPFDRTGTDWLAKGLAR